MRCQSKHISLLLVSVLATFSCARSDETSTPASDQVAASERPSPVQSAKDAPVTSAISDDLKAYLVADAAPANFAQQVRSELIAKGIKPLDATDFRQHAPAQVALGKALFFDRILSGNRTVACASCHTVWRGAGDGVSLQNDIGIKRLMQRIDRPMTSNFLPRNAMPLFNRGHAEYRRAFWDGRVEPNAAMPSGFSTPAGQDLPQGLESVLAAQSLFPLTSPEEMLGHPGDNFVSSNFTSPKDIWAALMRRIMLTPDYMTMLRAAYPGVADAEFGIQHIGNAIAAFEDIYFRADNSAFDKFLRGDDSVMTTQALQGAEIFYSRAMCSTCHAGSLQSDQDFHAIAVPQFGPGKNQGINGQEDFGRGGVTGLAADRYKFRTPSLRNVFLSGPWGHDGAFRDLKDYVRHYGSPVASMQAWDPNQTIIRAGSWPQAFFLSNENATARNNIIAANQFPGVAMSAQDIEWIMYFMASLTDQSFQQTDLIPTTVPSGLNDFMGVSLIYKPWFDMLRTLPWL